MTQERLSGRKVAILATDGFEESELLKPMQALKEAGAEVKVVSDHPGEIKGWKKDNWGEKVRVDLTLANTDAEAFDALMLPGGVMNPDKLRMNNLALHFIREFFMAGKPVAAICHGPQLLIEAKVLNDATVTSWPSLQTDIVNAGAHWVDESVVVDNGLVTSRKPDDIPDFNAKMIEEFAEGRHYPRAPVAQPTQKQMQ